MSDGNEPICQRRREWLRALLAAGGAASLNTIGWAQELTPLPPVKTTLRVLFFNTHLLPAVAQGIAGNRGQDDYRTRAIATQLHQYDIVGLCEVFEKRRRRELATIVDKNSGNAFHWIESPAPTGRHFVCGGLLLLTRAPLEGEPHSLTYSKASRAYSHGYKADGFAAKGAIHARLQVSQRPSVSVDCFLTHLESVSTRARAAQIEEFAEFIAEHSSPERPVILMGDLNVAADYPVATGAADSEYRRLTTSLEHAGRPLVDVWPALHSSRGGTRDALARENCARIDYIFTSAPTGANAVSLQPSAVRVQPFLDPTIKEGSLSDHSGIECEFLVRR